MPAVYYCIIGSTMCMFNAFRFRYDMIILSKFSYFNIRRNSADASKLHQIMSAISHCIARFSSGILNTFRYSKLVRPTDKQLISRIISKLEPKNMSEKQTGSIFVLFQVLLFKSFPEYETNY